jgi:hypothetical protein
MLWDMTDSAEVVRVAVPPLKLPVPMAVAPSLNVTLPVGVPKPGLFTDTVAVKTTDWPNTDGFDAGVTAVAVEAAVTFCVTLDDVEPLKLPSPP